MAKQRRSSSRHPIDRAGTAERAAFHDLVERALAYVPQPFARALDEVAIVVEDRPSQAQRRSLGLRPDEDLYGLFEGVPRTEWEADWAAFPNKITLFRIALKEDFPDDEEIKEQVRITVLHELAHYLGIDDRRLHELGVE
jgi:predicted Zn-dependent protease with MMP-like domain